MERLSVLQSIIITVIELFLRSYPYLLILMTKGTTLKTKTDHNDPINCLISGGSVIVQQWAWFVIHHELSFGQNHYNVIRREIPPNSMLDCALLTYLLLKEKTPDYPRIMGTLKATVEKAASLKYVDAEFYMFVLKTFRQARSSGTDIMSLVLKQLHQHTEKPTRACEDKTHCGPRSMLISLLLLLKTQHLRRR